MTRTVSPLPGGSAGRTGDTRTAGTRGATPTTARGTIGVLMGNNYIIKIIMIQY